MTGTPDPSPKRDKDNQLGSKAACAERLTSIDTKQKRMIFTPKALQDPEGSRKIGESVQNAIGLPPDRTRQGLPTHIRECQYPVNS